MRDEPHTHRCATCGQPFECEGDWVAREDEDGRMIPRCVAFHLRDEDQCDRCLMAPAPPVRRACEAA